MTSTDFVHVTYPEPHLERTRRLLREHPEVKALFGPVRASALLVVGLLAVQIGLAWAVSSSPWYLILALAWLVGAFADHTLWVLIHECSHNLVFRSARANSALSILANLPILFPGAISFRKYHLLHHRFQGDPSYDADLASPTEAALVGNVGWRKALWLLLFFVAQATRVPRLKRVDFWDGWYAANLVAQLTFIALVGLWLGPAGLFYLFLSSIFAIGLHPVGARWIQEHYLTAGEASKQETFSYYGPLNWPSLNVGYHNEHHDLMRVPWNRLPRVKAIAPEYYDGLVSHRSWTRLLLRFLFDPSLGLYSRRVRNSEVSGAPARVEGLAAAERIAAQA